MVKCFVSGVPNVNISAGDIKVYIDGTSVTPTITSKTNAKKLSVPEASRRGKKCRIELANQTGTVDSIGFIFRPLGVTDVTV